MDYLIFEPSDEDVRAFGNEILAFAWSNASHALNSYDPTQRRPDDAL